jgi:3,2-trans-enoyl-CoA isomerase
VGFDVREFNSSDENRLREFWTVAQDCWLKLYGSYYPTAAAINGHNPAGGCFFSMSCEYRVMVPKSKIGLSGARLGIAMPLPIILAMQSVLTPRNTELAITSGTLFTTEEALSIGLIDEIAEDKTDAIRKCVAFLDRFKKIPPNARASTKLVLRKKHLDEIANNRKRDVDEFVAAVTSPEAKQSFEFFLDPSKKKQ